jgi:hypothetical protein
MSSPAAAAPGGPSVADKKKDDDIPLDAAAAAKAAAKKKKKAAQKAAAQVLRCVHSIGSVHALTFHVRRLLVAGCRRCGQKSGGKKESRRKRYHHINAFMHRR